MPEAVEPIRPQAKDVAFELERFELDPSGRLELNGRWFGVRGRRFVRPTLTFAGDGERSRSLADLEHKPWSPGEGELWTAAFPWEFEGAGVEDVELAVAPDIAIALPPPRGMPPAHRGGRRARARPRRGDGEQRDAPLDTTTADSDEAPRRREPSEIARLQRDVHQLTAEVASARRDLERVGAERDDALSARVQVLAERDEAALDRDRVAGERDAAAAERDAAWAERDAAWAERDAAWAERDATAAALARSTAEREEAASDRDQALAARDRALAERDAAIAARDAAAAERDAA
ncbi:MAG: hypothetical protein JO181_20615, partial [Solirubrobacterales bacterium]|nr:hypothetical protein [Solirubrobacterales bacterium]